MKFLTFIFLCSIIMPAFAGNRDDALLSAEQIFEATRITCSGISDEISKVSNVSKVNTAVTAVGTVAAGGALVVGIKKSQEEEEIDRLIAEICNAGGCSAENVSTMSDETFFKFVLQPMSQIAELQEKINTSKKFGNWRTGLMAGTIGTNLASAIMSGLNVNQSDLVQHVSACNEMIKSIPDVENELRKAGVNPDEYPIVKQLSSARTWCNQIDVKDIEKIEKRMKGVMGTSIAGTAIGVVGVGTSAAANSDKYMSVENKLNMTDSDRKKEKALNTTANVMAGANVATGAVETGLNISLITLTKKLMEQSQRCEDVLK